MIQIDDAGSGSLLGSTIIGILRVETKQFEYGIIPLEYYQDIFEEKKYITYVTKMVKKILLKLNVPKDEEIQVCRGYMFEDLNKWLKNEGYHFINTTIDDPLQTIIENEFEAYAVKLGLPQSFISYTKYPFHFHRLLKWVYADYHNRSILCKTGWKSWKKYGSLELKSSREIIKKNGFNCLKCNQPIPLNSTATVKSFISNRHYKILLHTSCS